MTKNSSLMKQLAAIAAVAVSGAVFAGPASAADLAAGEKLAQERCASCHGKDFKTPIDPTYPKLAGQHADYLEAALRSYPRKSGVLRRAHPIMEGQTGTLSDADRKNLAAYLASLPGDFYIRH